MNTHSSVQNCKSISGILAIAVACFLLLPFVFLSGCGKEETTTPQAAEDEGTRQADTETSPTDQTEPVAERSGDYEEVDPSELALSIKGSYYDSVVTEDGIKPVGGKVGEFTCKGLALELATNEFVYGFIATKKYGKLKVRFSSSSVGPSYSLWLTHNQKIALKTLKWQIESDNARFIAKYGPILEKNGISLALIRQLSEGDVPWTDVAQPEQEILVDVLKTTPDELRIQQLVGIAASLELRSTISTI